MNIVLGQDIAEQLKNKHVVLELDTFHIETNDQLITAYCVTEDLSVQSLMQCEQMKDLHEGLLKNYRKKNWNYCLQALDHLRGKWDGQLDSFYDDMRSRIVNWQINDPGIDWDGTINKK